MFNLFKKKIDNNIYSPISGKCLDITECSDSAFSSGFMGDGFMIKPTENIVNSPCDGVITMLFPTKHAFGIKMSNGNEILVHVGINTVELDGKYFESLSSVNKKVKKGTPIIKYDLNDIKELGYDTSVLVIISGNEKVSKNHIDEDVAVGDVIIGG